MREALLAWYAANARDLPWRRTRDPYRVLVSEIMLQQIQVARAIPFYLAFLERFPTVEALAAATRADVIRTWGDLGRYRRAADLHETARLIVAEHGGRVPRDPTVLRTLPGIGPYTAGAVACFAYEDDTAFIDTNIRRVLHRVFVGPDVPAPTATATELLRVAAAAVPPGGGWTWNQALMELGALRCTARRPACGSCPVVAVCRATPTLPAALAVAPRAVRSATSSPPGGAHRVYRGRVLAALRDLPAEEPAAALPMDELGRRVRPGFADADLPWLTGVVDSLAAHGLVAIEEERPAYDAGPAVAPARVRLP
jgi:A/G-specific adenine glycosylase